MIELTYLNHFLTDRDVAEIAWVSTKKGENRTEEDVYRLIRFLAREGHDSPFHHPKVHLHLKAPIFVLRQLVKHRVGVDWNEKSYRYVEEDDVEIFGPDEWRGKSEKRIQGSGQRLDFDCDLIYSLAIGDSINTYHHLLQKGVAPEQARMVLPLSLMTEVRLTLSLLAAFRIWKLRSDKNAQKEIQDVAKQLDKICFNIWPISWIALKENSNGA